MNNYFKFFLLTSVFSWYLPVFSQNIDGHWFGTGKVQSAGIHDEYLTELVLRQSGKKISGELDYYFKDGYFITPITGTYDTEHRLLILKDFELIHFKSTNAQNGFTTMMTGEFILRVSRTESVLSGILKSDAGHRYTTPLINFLLTKSNDTMPAKIEAMNDLIIDSLNIQSSVTQVVSSALPLQKKETERSKNITREITVNSSLIKLEFYDSGEIDYDSISVFMNNKMILPKSMLNYDALKLTIHLDENQEYTDISMFANNVGLIPPNSAVLILYDGNKRYEIEMNSDLEKSATIRLRKKKN